MVGMRLVRQVRQLLRKKQAPFPFFDLPPEIRNRVYAYAVEDASREFWLVQRKPSFQRQLPAILRANAQLAREAAGYYWSSGHFDFIINLDRLGGFTTLLEQLGDLGRSFLRRNPSVCVRVIFPKNSEDYDDFSEFSFLGARGAMFNESPEGTGRWIFTAEKAGVHRLSKMFDISIAQTKCLSNKPESTDAATSDLYMKAQGRLMKNLADVGRLTMKIMG